MRLTVGQAIVRFLAAQHGERDGVSHRLIEGCFGIFEHGNVAGLGEALLASWRPAQALADQERESVVERRFGTAYRYRNKSTGRLDGGMLPVDLAANAASLGAQVIRAATIGDLTAALQTARSMDGPVVIVIETDPLASAPDSQAWWDVPVAEVSELESVRRARAAYEAAHPRQRRYL